MIYANIKTTLSKRQALSDIELKPILYKENIGIERFLCIYWMKNGKKTLK